MRAKRLTTLCCGLLLAAAPAWAEEIGQVSTTFKFVGANDKIVIEAFDDPDISGATMYAVAVTYRPAGGDPIETTIDQSFLPVQLEGLSEGQQITVKYDPSVPTSALIHSW